MSLSQQGNEVRIRRRTVRHGKRGGTIPRFPIHLFKFHTVEAAMLNKRFTLAVFVLFLFANVSAYAQVTRDQYERALSMRERYRNLALNIADSPTWVRGAGHRFWYRKSVEGGGTFVLVDADAGTRAPVFDHEKIAAALSRASGGHYTAVTLPFRSFRYTEGAIE